MASSHITPGVNIEDQNAFPNPVVAVQTEVPVFIGYTDMAERNGESLARKAVRITSIAEYSAFFGKGFKSKFVIADSEPNQKEVTFTIDKTEKVLKFKENNTFYLYHAIRLFYANGGASAYIISIGTYRDKPDGFEISAGDIIGSDGKPGALDFLLNEPEPTLVLIPDAISLGEDCYSTIYTRVLAHCQQVQSRFAIFDLVQPLAADQTDIIVASFRDKIGINALNYGAAYYPWLKTTIIEANEIDFENIDPTTDLGALLPEEGAKDAVSRFKQKTDPDDKDKRNYHLSLKANSSTYVRILEEVKNKLNELPPSGAMAGIYTMVDSTGGVWKAPANVSLSMVSAPSVNISNEEQEKLNIDEISGKSINVIRLFSGIGTLVWGARTLDGNSQDWRYINVRRTLIMIEQSLKLAARMYVFEPNDANTWATIKSMFNNFLFNLWKQGALAGAVPEQAFSVAVGLGETISPGDIINGIMMITVLVAVVHPSEFIVLTFEQQMQQS